MHAAEQFFETMVIFLNIVLHSLFGGVQALLFKQIFELHELDRIIQHLSSAWIRVAYSSVVVYNE